MSTILKFLPKHGCNKKFNYVHYFGRHSDSSLQLSDQLHSSLPPLLVSVLVTMETDVTDRSYVDYMYQLTIQLLEKNVWALIRICDMLPLVEPCTKVANIYIRIMDRMEVEKNIEVLKTLAQKIMVSPDTNHTMLVQNCVTSF